MILLVNFLNINSKENPDKDNHSNDININDTQIVLDTKCYINKLSSSNNNGKVIVKE